MSADPWEAATGVPAVERSFYETQFTGSSLVVALTNPDADAVEQVRRVALSLDRARAHLVLVVDGHLPPGGWASALPAEPLVLAAPAGPIDVGWAADLWMAVGVSPVVVVVETDPGTATTVAGRVAASLRALKLVLTDPDGGWGEPPRSFADVQQPAKGFAQDLASRQGGQVVPAIEEALAGGVTSVNLCRAGDLDAELFTFDGTGTLFTSGGYIRLDRLRAVDLPEVLQLVEQGTADGLLRPRSTEEVARLAVTGLGARVLGSDQLAGIVSLEVDRYRAEAMGEVACLYAVSRFSGAGAGGLLIDGLVERAAADGLKAVFAVTVSAAAAGFFTRKGFREVEQSELPDVKWDGYDDTRRSLARAFLRSTADSF
ncbi:MAG: GNAT family N-acetyltransferase [Aquihabitans sp.]